MIVAPVPTMFDWAGLSAVAAVAMLLGCAFGWGGRWLYYRGKDDYRLDTADLQHAASIVRLEASVKELTDDLHKHDRDDAANFAELRATVASAMGGLKTAADEMRALTARIDQILMPHGARRG